jgi:hypothetical protein
MHQMPEGQLFDARFFLPALCTNAAVREVMQLAFVNRVHSIRLAYLHRKLAIILCDSTASYPSVRIRVVLLRSRQNMLRASNNSDDFGLFRSVIELLARDACCVY